MPSNNVYRTLTDKNGYLWIATNRGIVKYNGYSSKVFDESSGVANADVWNMFEDGKGRIWLASISNEIGYVYRNDYRPAFIDDPTYIYPTNFIEYKDGIACLSGNRRDITNLCIERNDSVYTIPVSTLFSTAKYTSYLINQAGELISISKNGRISKTTLENGNIITQNICVVPGYRFAMLDNFLFPLQKRSPRDLQVPVVNTKNGRIIYLKLDKEETIKVFIKSGDYYYVTTSSAVHKFDRYLNLSKKIMLASLQDGGNSVKAHYTTIVEDSFWGTCRTTTNKGLYIELPGFAFKRSTRSYAGSSYIGENPLNGTCYLLSPEDRKVICVDNEDKLSEVYLPNLGTVNKIIPFATDSQMVLTDRGIYLRSKNNVRPFYDSSLHTYVSSNKKTVYLGRAFCNGIAHVEPILNDCIVDKKGTVYGVARGYGYTITKRSEDTLTRYNIDNGRYKHVIYDSELGIHIVYGDNNILIQKDTAIMRLGSDLLSANGIKNVHRILISKKTGHVFIHFADRLLLLDRQGCNGRLLFADFNLTKSHVLLHEDMVIAIGQFGIAYTYYGRSKDNYLPKTFINFKNSFYNEIYDSYVVCGTLMLNTDNGVYELPLDGIDSLKGSTSYIPYSKLVLSSLESTSVLRHVDTAVLQQAGPSLAFDFINPYGYGTVRYTYSIGGNKPRTSFSGDITLPVLQPGKFHTLSIAVADDLWIRKYKLRIYIVPYWWQTVNGKWWIILSSVLFVAILFSVSVRITRHILIAKHKKNNLYKELELKAIYAQLNPHFIFNTLTNIIYFVRTNQNKEASRHLTAFSKLLRAYIRSARNKWLKIAEEIETLNNYILLQQSRFENKFEYAIEVDTELDIYEVSIPALLLQPIVENAIIHGLQHRQDKGNLLVRFERITDEQALVIIVEDNGIGRNSAKGQKPDSNKKESYGASLIQNLVSIFERYEKSKIDIQYIDILPPETGTRVTITIRSKG